MLVDCTRLILKFLFAAVAGFAAALVAARAVGFRPAPSPLMP